MSEEKIYKILGEFQGMEIKEFGGVTKYVIEYKQPNSATPAKVWKHQATESALSDKAIDILSNASTGERICVHQGKDGQYPCIVDISDASDVPVKPAYTGGNKFKQNYTPKDDSGVAVGAAWANAIALYGTIPETDTTVTDEYLDQVENIAARILKRKLAMEDKLRASKVAKGAVTAKAEEAPKPKSRIELAKEKKAQEAKSAPKEIEEVEELVDDDLDDVQF